jgi:hypothetical protein
VGDDVYLMGSGFAPCQTFNVYVVNHKNAWSNCDPIPSPVVSATVSSDVSGNIAAQLIWRHDLAQGKYDIVVDVNGDCIYEQGVDCLDANDCTVHAGFFVIPEYVLGAILGLAGFFAAYGVFRLSKRPHP